MARGYKWSEEIELAAWDYIDNYKDHDHAIPSIVGLCKVLDVARSTLYEWAGQDDKDFKDILEAVNEAQEFKTLNESLRGEYNSAIAKLVLAKHGYHDKQDQTLSAPGGGAVKIENTLVINPVSSGSNTD